MEQIGRYKIVGELGRGAMGIVFKAQDPAIGRLIAIKSIRLGELTDESERERLRERLFREAQSAGILSHPGIVTIYDIAEEGGMAYIFMELVNGPPLEKMLKAEQTPDKETLLSLLRQVAAALDYAHKKGIVHRDIKPANIMVHEDGTAKVTDFGVAKIVSQQMTQTGTIMGTPSYMSPEQVQGAAVSGRSDQFSLAVIAYEILTGEKPFNAEYLPTLLFKIVREEPVAPHRLNPTLMPVVESVMRKAMAKNPEERYETCVDFVNALAAACNASGHWVPLPRGASPNMPTAGSSDRLKAASAEFLDETVAAPLAEMTLTSSPSPSATASPPPIPATPERLTKDATADWDATIADAPAPVRSTASDAKPLETSIPDVSSPASDGAGNASAPLSSAEVKSAEAEAPPSASAPIPTWTPRSRQEPVAESHGLRNVLLGLIVGLAIVGGVFYFMRQSSPPPASSETTGTQAVAPAAPSTPDTVPAPPSANPQTASAPSAEPPKPPPPPARPPAPTEATFHLTTTPAGVEATIDGSPEFRCTSPCSLNLALGRHTIVMRHEGYREVQRVFNLPDDPGLIVNMELQTGTLSLSSTPAGLAIVVDGQEQARKTPTNLSLPIGSHRIQILKGSEKQEFVVNIRDGVLTERNVDWGN